MLITPSEWKKYVKENNLETEKEYFDGEMPELNAGELICFTDKNKPSGYIERIIEKK